MFQNYKLGKLEPKQDSRTLRLANYIEELPTIPHVESWLYKPELKESFDWLMLRNDEMGNCAIVGPAHIEMIWSYNSSTTPFIPTNECVVQDYSNVSGYNPNDPSTDRGCYLLEVMNYWRQRGICNRKISSYVSVNPDNLHHVKAAIHLFGAVNIGLALPASAQSQNDVWTVTNPNLTGSAARNTWGGHCVIIGEYDDVTNEFVCVTWGRRQRMTYNFFTTYCDECYAALSDNWISNSGFSPGGFDIASLRNDMRAVV
jgi:hypothetical protein